MFFASRLYGSCNLTTFYDSLPIPSSTKLRSVAAFLDVRPETLKRWLDGTRPPPRAAVIALFHESPYGLSATSTHSANGEALARRMAASLQADNDALRAIIAELQRELAASKLDRPRQRYTPMNEPRYKIPGAN